MPRFQDTLRPSCWPGGVLILAMSCQGRSSDCFGGALSSDPIHCDVFDWAHNEGVIDVDVVYRMGNSLYIYLTQTDRLDEATRKKMPGKSQGWIAERVITTTCWSRAYVEAGC